MKDGKCVVASSPRKTTYFWGPMSDIAGKTLECIERNENGDCLCFNGKGLIDVDKEDVAEFREAMGHLFSNLIGTAEVRISDRNTPELKG